MLERIGDRARKINITISSGDSAYTSTQVYAWKDQTLLPIDTSTAKIRENFIALLWPEDIGSTASEVHLFSTEDGMLLTCSVTVRVSGRSLFGGAKLLYILLS